MAIYYYYDDDDEEKEEDQTRCWCTFSLLIYPVSITQQWFKIFIGTFVILQLQCNKPKLEKDTNVSLGYIYFFISKYHTFQ